MKRNIQQTSSQQKVDSISFFWKLWRITKIDDLLKIARRLQGLDNLSNVMQTKFTDQFFHNLTTESDKIIRISNRKMLAAGIVLILNLFGTLPSLIFWLKLANPAERTLLIVSAILIAIALFVLITENDKKNFLTSMKSSVANHTSKDSSEISIFQKNQQSGHSHDFCFFCFIENLVPNYGQTINN